LYSALQISNDVEEKVARNLELSIVTKKLVIDLKSFGNDVLYPHFIQNTLTTINDRCLDIHRDSVGIFGFWVEQFSCCGQDAFAVAVCNIILHDVLDCAD
jgi:hypothetical protein